MTGFCYVFNHDCLHRHPPVAAGYTCSKPSESNHELLSKESFFSFSSLFCLVTFFCFVIEKFCKEIVSICYQLI
jgi:hypothetical protein